MELTLKFAEALDHVLQKFLNLNRGIKINELGTYFEDQINGVDITTLIDFLVTDGKIGFQNEFYHIDRISEVFLLYGGYTRQWEELDNSRKALRISEEALEVAYATLAKTNTNTHWVIFGAITALVLLLISHDLKEVLQILLHL